MSKVAKTWMSYAPALQLLLLLGDAPEAASEALAPAREKADGRYAAGLLLQLPAPGVRFRCKFQPDPE